MDQVLVIAFAKHIYNCKMLDISILNAIICVKFKAVDSFLGKVDLWNECRNYSHIYGATVVNIIHWSCMVRLFLDI